MGKGVANFPGPFKTHPPFEPLGSGKLMNVNVKHLRHVLTYGSVGALGYVVDLAALMVAQPILGLYAGRAASYLFGAAVVFMCNRRFTFGIKTFDGFWPQFGRFFVSQLAGACANYAVSISLMTFASGLLATRPVALAAGVAAGAGFNFVLFHRVVFRTHKTTSP